MNLQTPANEDFAQIEVLPSDQADRILSARSVAWLRRLIVIGPLFLVGGMGLAVWGGGWLGESIEQENPTKRIYGLALSSLGYFLLVICVPLAMPRLRNRWLHHVARLQISRRLNRLVNPNAPDVRFVEVVPKSNWHDETLTENADDVGFLAIDHQNHALFFEGDNERYRIPAVAIVSCEKDYYTHVVVGGKYQGNYLVSYYFVVVTVRISEQATAEIPFRIRHAKGRFNEEAQRSANYELLKEINQLKRV